MTVWPAILITRYVDGFGNIGSRILAPAGDLTLTADALVADSGVADTADHDAVQHPIEDLPHDTLVYLLGGRYCDAAAS